MKSIDWEFIRQYEDLDSPGEPSFFVDLLQTLKATYPRYLSQLKISRTAGDLSAFKKAAHALKGSFGNVGAKEICSKFQQLETVSNLNDPDIDSKIRDLELLLEPTIDLLLQSTKGR